MTVDDIDAVRELHEQWFPIKYQQSFYDGAAQGIWRETGHPLFTRLAVQSSDAFDDDDDEELQRGFTSWPRPQRRRSVILGAVMASLMPLSSVEDPDLIDKDASDVTHVMYILTLGCRSTMRRRGIASALLDECMREAQRVTGCGAVYLHVKSDNIKALQFYEKNGFVNLRYLEDYYLIHGTRHAAYLYIRYVNGGMAQRGWLETLAAPLVALFSLAGVGLKRLLDGLLEDDSDDDNRDSNDDDDAGGTRDVALQVSPVLESCPSAPPLRAQPPFV
ncbi:hypothetical protein PINS_up009786 [Pythium insidiosum]|nr:hypothetical protein PINS_up009786 [Pythium insidiosum]